MVSARCRQRRKGRSTHGYRAIAHDRRAHGRSRQPWTGHELDTYADDLAQLIERLDLREAVLVGHSTGGGEVTRSVGRHGSARVAKVVLLGAIPPLMLKSEPFYAANRPGNQVSQGMRDSFWLWSLQVGLKGPMTASRRPPKPT